MLQNIVLYVPSVNDYWYEQRVQTDPLSMSYNAGYDVSYYGYHYDTGCIDFPEERWKETYEKRIRENRYFAYIKDNDINIQSNCEGSGVCGKCHISFDK